MNLLVAIISLANLLTEGAGAVRLIRTRNNRLTQQENHNWNTTCIGIVTIATIIMIGLFGSIQLASNDRPASPTTTCEQSAAHTSTTAQAIRESTPNRPTTDEVDNPCPDDTPSASENNKDAELLLDKVVRSTYRLIPGLVNALTTWAVAAYLGCVLFSFHTIFTEFPTRRAKIESARFSSHLLLTEAGLVGIIAIFTIIIADFAG